MTRRLSALLLIALVWGASCASAPQGEEPPAEPPPAVIPAETVPAGEIAPPDAGDQEAEAATVNPPRLDGPESGVPAADSAAEAAPDAEDAAAAGAEDTAPVSAEDAAVAEGAGTETAGEGEAPPPRRKKTPRKNSWNWKSRPPP